MTGERPTRGARARAPAPFRRPLALLMAMAFVDAMGAFLMLALLPFMVADMAPSGLGALVGAHALAFTASSTLWGRASDRYGRRPVLLAGVACSAASYLLFALWPAPLGLLCARLLQGLGSGVAAVVLSALAEVLPEDRRAEGIGWLTSVTSIAAVAGPLLGSTLTGVHPGAPSATLFALAALLLVAIAAAFPAQASARAAAAHPEASSAVGPSALLVLRRPASAPHRLIWLYVVGTGAWSVMMAVVALDLARRFGVTARSVWLFFAYLGGLSVLLRLFAVRPLVRRLGEWRALRLGALVFAAGLALMPWPRQVAAYALVVALVPIGTAWFFPAGTSLLSRHGGDHTGQLLGLQQAFGGVARMVGPVAAGFLFERSPVAPFWVSGVLVAVCGLIATRRRPPVL